MSMRCQPVFPAGKRVCERNTDFAFAWGGNRHIKSKQTKALQKLSGSHMCAQWIASKYCIKEQVPLPFSKLSYIDILHIQCILAILWSVTRCHGFRSTRNQFFTSIQRLNILLNGKYSPLNQLLRGDIIFSSPNDIFYLSGFLDSPRWFSYGFDMRGRSTPSQRYPRWPRSGSWWRRSPN